MSLKIVNHSDLRNGIDELFEIDKTIFISIAHFKNLLNHLRTKTFILLRQCFPKLLFGNIAITICIKCPKRINKILFFKYHRIFQATSNKLSII